MKTTQNKIHTAVISEAKMFGAFGGSIGKSRPANRRRAAAVIRMLRKAQRDMVSRGLAIGRIYGSALRGTENPANYTADGGNWTGAGLKKQTAKAE